MVPKTNREREEEKASGSVNRRTILQSTGAIIGLGSVPIGRAGENTPGDYKREKVGEKHIVEIHTQFRLDESIELAHTDPLSSYAIDVEKRKFYGFSRDETENNRLKQNSEIVIGDTFDTLPATINRNRESKELPANQHNGIPYQFLVIDSPIEFPTVDITPGKIRTSSGTKNPIGATVQGEDHMIESKEEILIELPSRTVTGINGENVDVTPQIIARNHDQLSTYITKI